MNVRTFLTNLATAYGGQNWRNYPTPALLYAKIQVLTKCNLLILIMNQTHRKSFLIILSLLFLLPIFFIPGGILSLGAAKSLLLSFGVIAAVLVFLLEIWRERVLNFPWHPFILTVALLPLVYFLSALLSTPSSLSLFGYSFEVGTFGFMLLGFVLLILIGTVFLETSRVLQALTAFFISLSLVAVFAVIKILSALPAQTGGFPVWGVFFGNSANPIGNWTDLAVAFGLLSVFSILVLGIIPMKKPLRFLVHGVFWLSTILLAIFNFSTAFIFTLGASVILFVYFLTVEKKFSSPSTFLPLVLGLVSIFFLINPAISPERGRLGDVVADTFGIVNSEVRPSFSATLDVSRAALSQRGTQGAFLGSGPNTFSRDWLTYKPIEINTTPFWGTSFPFGIGFIPTQIASTGILGTALWLVFFVFLIFLGVKVLANIPESRGLRFALVSSFIALLYLWTASFMYAPSFVILTLAFIFSGLFVAASRQINIISSRMIILSRDATTSFISTLLVVVVSLGFVSLGYVASNKTLSVFYFERAIRLSNMPNVVFEDIETALGQAVRFAPADVHYVALSRIHFARAQAAVADTKGSQEENNVIFGAAISKSIEAANEAVAVNPAGYQNWMTQGSIYSFLVPEPFAVSGAYENAKFAFSEAGKRNPASPEVPLFLAQLEFTRGEAEAARSLIRQSLVLKEDYADAYLMLARLEIQEKNIGEAIVSAEKLVLLLPANSGLYFELGLLRYSNENYTSAIEAMNQALVLSPDYANAKYYLGLSLAQLGRFSEALVQFEDLVKTNPDNEEVLSVLESLRAGKSPF